jgi:hypothetical protein
MSRSLVPPTAAPCLVQVKLIKCLIENIVVDISFNQLSGICTLCFLEYVSGQRWTQVPEACIQKSDQFNLKQSRLSGDILAELHAAWLVF